MSDLNNLLEDLGGFLRRMAAEQEEIGAIVATALGTAVSENLDLAFALQHFDRTRQNLEAVGDVMMALSSGVAPTSEALPIHLEELQAWLDGERHKDVRHSGDVDLF